MMGQNFFKITHWLIYTHFMNHYIKLNGLNTRIKRQSLDKNSQ